MAAAECPRESDVLDALQTAGWPDGGSDELRAHVEACQQCGDLIAIVTPLVDEHRAAIQSAPVPTSATVWWRMRLRARREAAATAMRPISIVQGLALACGAGLLLAAIEFVSPAIREFGSWMVGAGGEVVSASATSSAGTALDWLSPLGLAAVLAATLVLVVTPVAIYLAVRDQ